MVIWVILLFVASYVVTILSPFPRYVGRTNPLVASWFSPPLFNFGAYYTDGQVLGFRIGDSKLSTARILSENYMATARFNNACGGGTLGILTFDDEQKFWDWGKGKDIWCFFNGDTNSMNELHFDAQTLVKIRVVKVNIEAI